MINKELYEIQTIMLRGLNRIEHWNWSKTFAEAKSKAVFSTAFFQDGFAFKVTITVEKAH